MQGGHVANIDQSVPGFTRRLPSFPPTHTVEDSYKMSTSASSKRELQHFVTGYQMCFLFSQIQSILLGPLGFSRGSGCRARRRAASTCNAASGRSRISWHVLWALKVAGLASFSRGCVPPRGAAQELHKTLKQKQCIRRPDTYGCTCVTPPLTTKPTHGGLRLVINTNGDFVYACELMCVS